MAEREVIVSAGAPAAIGPYSQAIRAGGLLFVSGQIPLDPETGQVVAGGIAAQAERVLDSLRAILDACGSGLERVVKTTVFLTDLGTFTEVNEVYARFFPARAPGQGHRAGRGPAARRGDRNRGGGAGLGGLG